MSVHRLLSRLKLDRIDLVPTGANPKAHITLFKSAEKPPERRISFSTQLSGTSSSLLTPWVSKEAEVPEKPEKDQPAAEVTVTIGDEEKTFSADEIAELHDRAEKSDADAEKLKADLEKALKDRKDKVKKDDASAAELQEQLDKIEKERETEQEERKTDRDELAKLRKSERHRTFVDKAKEFENLAAHDQIADVLDEADEHLGGKANETLGKILKAANEQAEASLLFKQLADPDAEPTGFDEKVAKLAKERVEKSDGKLTIEQAKVQVVSENPELRREYQEARS